MKKFLPPLLVLILVFAAASCAAPAAGSKNAGLITIPRAADGEFKTPEDALKCFTNGLKKNDFFTAAKAFAIYEIPEHMNYVNYADRLKASYMPAGLLPEQYSGPNSAILLGQAANCYKSAVMCLCGMDPSEMQLQNSPGDTTNFMDAISPEKLAGTMLATADMETTFSDDMKVKHRENMAAEAKAYGADECRAYIVTLRLDGNKADCEPFIMLRYGSNWHILGGVFTFSN